MRKNNIPYAFLLSFIAQIFIINISLFAASRTVAVINFTNHTGSGGLQYLSTALPESISTSLSQVQNIRVVERNRLIEVVKEIELGQTGLFDEKSVIKTGKMIQADVIILGSFTGNPNEVILSIKAVDVKTGKVLEGKVVKSPLATLFDSANQAAISMTAMITGADSGMLSISTTPDGADIYVDGMLIGKSPIVEAKLLAGQHRLKATKSGYTDAETTITINKNAMQKWTPYLAESRLRNRSESGIAVYYFIPVKKQLQNAPLYSIFIGQNFQRLCLTAEAGYSRIRHDQEIDSPFGEITQERWYNYYLMHGHISYAPLEIGSYLMPYFGIFGGWGYLSDFRKNTSYEDDEEKLSSQSIWSLGPKAGIVIVPFSKVSLFLETRFLYTVSKINRKAFESGGLLGGLIEKDTQYHFNAFTIGGGLKYYF